MVSQKCSRSNSVPKYCNKYLGVIGLPNLLDHLGNSCSLQILASGVKPAKPSEVKDEILSTHDYDGMSVAEFKELRKSEE